MRTALAAVALASALAATWLASAQTASSGVKPALAVTADRHDGPEAGSATVPGMPGVADRNNLYSETGANRFSAAVAQALVRVYVPNRVGNTVSVIDPVSLKVVDTIKVGVNPQHVVPSWDLGILWVANNAERRKDGSLTPIDPKTGKPGPSIPVDDPYNMYWSPDGHYAIVVGEAYKRLDFRDVATMALKFSIPTPSCVGINHADFSIDGKFALFTCEFNASIIKVDLVHRTVLGSLALSRYFARPDALELIARSGRKPARIADPAQPGNEIHTTPGMPQDVRVSPDGKTFFVADLTADGVHVVDGDSFKQTGFIATGVGAHGLYPSRDGKSLYVANRGSNTVHGSRLGKGSISVIDFNTRTVTKTWPISGGGSPDMGNVSADGNHLWLSGRFDDVVYRFDTRTGAVDRVNVGREPHGLTVWPQPGRYSLGHTGNLR